MHLWTLEETPYQFSQIRLACCSRRTTASCSAISLWGWGAKMTLRTCRHLLTRAVAVESRAPRLCGPCIIFSGDGLSTGKHYFVTILGLFKSLIGTVLVCQSNWNLPDIGSQSAVSVATAALRWGRLCQPLVPNALVSISLIWVPNTSYLNTKMGHPDSFFFPGKKVSLR